MNTFGLHTLGLRARINRLRRKIWHALFFRMLFGEISQRKKLPHTRISPTACIESAQNLILEDNVFIGHFNFIEASSGIHIGQGSQITNFVSIVSHSTHRSIRLAAQISGETTMLSDVRAGISIGSYCFIGPHSVIEAGAVLGHACLVQSGSTVRGKFPDFSVIGGNPARIIGDVRDNDRRWLAQHPQFQAAYDAWLESLR